MVLTSWHVHVPNKDAPDLVIRYLQITGPQNSNLDSPDKRMSPPHLIDEPDEVKERRKNRVLIGTHAT